MNEIYRLKEEVLDLYRKNGTLLVIGLRTIVALISVVLINLNIGALEEFTGLLVVFTVAIIVGILPISLGTVVLICFTLGHVFAISYVAAGIIAVILFVLFVFGKLFSPRETYLFVAAFVMCLMGGTYAVPLALAMVGSSLGVVSILGGVAWFCMVNLVSDMKNLLAEGGVTEAVFTVLEGIAGDRIISLTLVAAGLSYIVATVIKNMSINESWKLGLFSGGACNLAVVVVGGLFTSASVPFASLLIGTTLGIVLGLIAEVFVHNVDYRGVETLSFEDDEYCYYVKAVPKKDPPPALEIQEPTKAELRQQAKEQNGTRKGQRPQRVSRERTGKEIDEQSIRKQTNSTAVQRGKKETPQEKRARERVEYKQNS